MNKKTRAEVEALRAKLGDLTDAIAKAVDDAEEATRKKAVREATERTEELAAKRKKAWRKLEALAPGQYTVEGWATSGPESITQADAEAGERAVLGGKTLAEAADAQRATLDAERADATETPGWKAAGERHLEHLARIETLTTEMDELSDLLHNGEPKKKARKAAEARIAEIEAEVAGYRKATAERANVVAHETTARNLTTTTAETDAEIKARVQAKRAAREAESKGKATAEAAEATTVAEPTSDSGRTEAEVEEWLDKPGETIEEVKPKAAKAKKAKPAPTLYDPDEPAEVVVAAHKTSVTDMEAPGEDAPTVEDPEPTVRRDRWDRPIILTPEGTEEGYRRMTTFIDCLEDKTTLVDWKQRVVVVGVAAIEQKAAGGDGIPEVMGIDEVGNESVLERVEASNTQFAAAMKTLRKDLRKGRIDSKAFEDAAAQVEKAQKAELNALVSEAFTAGDGFLKAEAGTRLHKLMELEELGQPLPDDVTDLERRDIAAVKDAYRQLGWKTIDVERFVVRDDLKAAGTLDRRGTYDSPTLGRRVIAIGDLKTGRMDFGAAKMARQLAGYAGGKGWNPAKPEERENLRCNREVGLIFHIPSGSGVCSVYELDLKLGDKGLKLCSAVYAYRTETSTLTKVSAAKDGKPLVVAAIESLEAGPEVAA